MVMSDLLTFRLQSRFRGMRETHTALPSPRSPVTQRVSSSGVREERRMLQTSRIQTKVPVLTNTLRIEDVYVKSCVGTRKGVEKSVNQDQWFDERWEGGRLVGICDGHGVNGHPVAQLLSRTLPHFLLKQLTKTPAPPLQPLISTAYQELSRVIRTSTIDMRTSGSTCLTVVITPPHLLCANVGDSRAILGRNYHGIWSVHQLSWDHRPDSPSESKRIVDCGGEVAISKIQHSGPMRVYVKGGLLPGLAVSRTFGDEYAAGSGVISEPDIYSVQLTSKDKFLILASDGLWEVFSSIEVVRLVGAVYRTYPELVCQRLVEEARRRWSRKGTSMDDITVVFLVFTSSS